MSADIKAQIYAGRALMRAAFVELLAQSEKAGVDGQELRRVQWTFFDGNQAINEAISR